MCYALEEEPQINTQHEKKGTTYYLPKAKQSPTLVSPSRRLHIINSLSNQEFFRHFARVDRVSVWREARSAERRRAQKRNSLGQTVVAHFDPLPVRTLHLVPDPLRLFLCNLTIPTPSRDLHQVATRKRRQLLAPPIAVLVRD
jgi:hypothetical protein